MLPVTERELRASFVNASRKDIDNLSLPGDFDAIEWDRLDYLGWRDVKFARRAYVVVPTLDGRLTGVLLRQADSLPRTRAQCSWCQDVTLPNDVVFCSAKRAGKRGRNGDTVGTLVCQDFQCSQNVRKTPPLAYEGYDVEAARRKRIDELQRHAAAFAAQVQGPASV